MADLLDILDIFSARYQSHLQNTDARNLSIPSDKTIGYYLSLALMSYQDFFDYSY